MPDFPLQVVWFKRDLRLRDHAPLREAAQRGPCLCLYIYEPEVLQSAEFDASHLTFINQSLSELDEELRSIGAHLKCLHGQVPEVFEYLWKRHRFANLWSHEETGSARSRNRDARVAQWCEARGVAWTEMPQTGVIRRRKQQIDWAKRWDERMHRSVLPVPSQIMSPNVGVGVGIMSHSDLGLSPSSRDKAVPGGETAALYCMESFFKHRGMNHRRVLSSPANAFDSSSRISAHLAWGTISLRSVVQMTESHYSKLRADSVRDKRWASTLLAFLGRLRWRCHFMQKFEDHPEMEFQNMDPACNGLRENEYSEYLFEAWCAGQTGYPLIDASMRCLQSTGWLNFRMRALVMSFASQQLWLHWEPTARYLARHFVDFEPGIHYPQCQSHAGTMGQDRLPILSPSRQVAEHDPHGQFIRQWVNELMPVPDEYIAEPWKMPATMQIKTGCVIGKSYPAPIVDQVTSVRLAREKFNAAKRKPEVKIKRPSASKSALPPVPAPLPEMAMVADSSAVEVTQVKPTAAKRPRIKKRPPVDQLELFGGPGME